MIKESLIFIAESDDKDKRLDAFLQEEMDDFTRSHIQKFIDGGNVIVEGAKKIKNGYKLKGNEKIKVNIPADEELKIEAEDIPLDIVYQEEIFRFCETLCKAGKTVIMVAHELNLAAKFCNRLLLVANGGILADGSPEEVLDAGHLSLAYNVPVKVIKNPNSGGIEITTLPSRAEEERKESLIKII